MTQTTQLDLSVYLVTDSTPEILGSKDICQVVERALEGGVTIVQFRDKVSETAALIETARKLHVITQKYKVPLLINDRIDVCQAVGAEGVHVGQDDIDVASARRILGPQAIIGVTASSVAESNAAIEAGADYLGLGTMFATPTKKDAKSIIGTKGVQEILSQCKTGTAFPVGCVAIGGIKASNVQRVMHQSSTQHNRLNGVAVVSAIMMAEDPSSAAAELTDKVRTVSETFFAGAAPSVEPLNDVRSVLDQIPAIISKHSSSSVLCHNMTNTVVQNFAANVCLATGSSPIMSTNPDEAADLAKLGGALVINMGTITAEAMEAYCAGLSAYNAAGQPVLFDPVGGGATATRRATIRTLLQAGFFTVIKGNEGEIGAVAGTSDVQQRGVDSGPSTSSTAQKIALVKALAEQQRCVVLMTGATDYLSDGARTIAIKNGSPLLGKMTGTGCALGAVVASYVALHQEDHLIAALAAILHYEIAAEVAAADAGCRGPGTFSPLFLDALHSIPESLKSMDISSVAKIEMM